MKLIVCILLSAIAFGADNPDKGSLLDARIIPSVADLAAIRDEAVALCTEDRAHSKKAARHCMVILQHDCAIMERMGTLNGEWVTLCKIAKLKD